MKGSPTLAAVRATLAEHAPDMVIRKVDGGEFRVTFSLVAIAAAFPAMTRAELIEKAESLAAYESDIESAYETGKAMYRTGLKPEAEAAAPVDSPVRVNLRRQRDAMAAIADAENPATVAVKTIDCTPTWAAVLPLLRAAIENGTPEGRRIAWGELSRMAEAADNWNASNRDAAAN